MNDVKESERNPREAGLDRYIGLEHIEPENLHIKEWGDLTQDGVSFTKRFRKGHVLFGKRRAYQRKVAVAEFDGICSSDILTFEPKDDTLIPALLPFIVQSDAFFDHALDTSSGSLSPRTRWSQLKDYEFPLPPNNEQTRIADTLWCATDCVERMSEVCEAARVARNAAHRKLTSLRSELQTCRTPCLATGNWSPSAKLARSPTGCESRSTPQTAPKCRESIHTTGQPGCLTI